MLTQLFYGGVSCFLASPKDDVFEKKRLKNIPRALFHVLSRGRLSVALELLSIKDIAILVLQCLPSHEENLRIMKKITHFFVEFIKQNILLVVNQTYFIF